MIGTTIFGILIGLNITRGQWSLALDLLLLFVVYLIVTRPANRRRR